METLPRFRLAWLVGAALLALTPASAGAQLPIGNGRIQFSWDACAPVVANVVGAQQAFTLYASVQGQDEAHQAYQVWLVVGARVPTLHEPNIGGVSDAWRFDATTGGCNAGRAAMSENSPAALSKSCPSFVPAATARQTVQIVQLANPNLGYGADAMMLGFAVFYPSGVVSDPSTRYHLAAFTFDHTHSSFGPTPTDGSSCGGLDCRQYLLPAPERCSWLTLDGQEKGFAGVHAMSVAASFNGQNEAGCEFVLPARAATWGAIKAQYKR